ncbi:MAG: hypothetical protein OCD02_21210, partial [Spirochaetaceae bacterium]
RKCLSTFDEKMFVYLTISVITSPAKIKPNIPVICVTDSFIWVLYSPLILFSAFTCGASCLGNT